MFEYLILFFFLIIFLIIRKSMNHQTEKYALAFLCIYMILLMGLRYRVGLDTISYMRSFDHLPSFEAFKKSNIFENRFEPGYMVICMLCKSFCKDFWLVQLVLAAITNIGIFVFIYRHCENPFWGVFTYIIVAWLYFSTEIIRESASISIFLLNYENLSEHKWIKYYLFSFLSISLHFSAIIIWLFPFVTNLKHVTKYYIILIIFFVACLPLFEYLNQYLTGSIAYRINGSIESARVLNMNWRIAFLIQSAILPIFSIYIAHKNNIDLPFKPFVLFHILLSAGAFSIPIVFSRFTNYTILFVCVYVSNLIVSSKLTPIIKSSLVIVVLASQWHYYFGMRMIDSWVPYHSIFEQVKENKRENMWRKHFHAV